MPNLVPPIATAAQAAQYRDRILAALPEGAEFEPLMTLYLTEDTDPDDVFARRSLRFDQVRQNYTPLARPPIPPAACAISTRCARCLSGWPRSG